MRQSHGVLSIWDAVEDAVVDDDVDAVDDEDAGDVDAPAAPRPAQPAAKLSVGAARRARKARLRAKPWARMNIESAREQERLGRHKR